MIDFTKSSTHAPINAGSAEHAGQRYRPRKHEIHDKKVTMKSVQVGIAAISALALTATLMNERPLTAQQPACLHGPNESPDQLARRRAALGITREINGLQAAFRRTPAYQPLAQLPVSGIPAGFAVQLVTDGTTYSFSVKDTLDPCRFGFFSDQDGLIFVGEVIK